MTLIFYIQNASCQHCKNSIESLFYEINGVSKVALDLVTKELSIESDRLITVTYLQKILEREKLNYLVSERGLKQTHKVKNQNVLEVSAYYCPMHCEGKKTYPKLGYCPICGMDLVGKTIESDAINHQKLLYKLIYTAIFTIPIFLISMSGMFANNPLNHFLSVKSQNLLQFLLSLPVIFWTGSMFFTRAWRSIISRNLNMFTLIGLGTAIAFGFSVVGLFFPDAFPPEFKKDGSVHLYFESSVIILGLALLGQFLEAKAHDKTKISLKSLIELAPSEATVIRNGKECLIPINDILVGDLVKIKPGDKIPVDGIILKGNATLDESAITGEAIPVDKTSNQKVYSGSINGNLTFTIKAEKVGSESLLSRIIFLVEQAGCSRAPIQKLADKVAKYFVPCVIFISLISFLVWVFIGSENAYMYGLTSAIGVLIISCPCALGLATPMSVTVGVGRGAKAGILIKNAEAIETMKKTNMLVIDKTGTLTEGKPSVEYVFSKNSNKENTLLKILSSINQYSEHPLAKSINDFTRKKGIKPDEALDFESLPGKGVKADINNETIWIGNENLINNISVQIPKTIHKNVSREQRLGKTVSYISTKSELIGYVVISDALKPNSKKIITEFMRQGIDVFMLTGDHLLTAKSVAKRLGINKFKAECLPQDKLKIIEKLQNQGKKVAMVGDGVNDAPGLAQANVGIAMGTGSDIAIECAQIVLVKGDLDGLVKARKLSHSIMKNIKRNLLFAFVYNIIGIPIAAGVLYPIFGVLLSPMVAAFAMSLSSVSVILNALRLKTLKL